MGERHEKGTFGTLVRSFLFKVLRGVGAGSLSLDDSPEEVVTAVGRSSAEGPLASSSGASGEDSWFSSSTPSLLSALASWSLGDHQLSVSYAKSSERYNQTKKELKYSKNKVRVQVLGNLPMAEELLRSKGKDQSFPGPSPACRSVFAPTD